MISVLLLVPVSISTSNYSNYPVSPTNQIAYCCSLAAFQALTRLSQTFNSTSKDSYDIVTKKQPSNLWHHLKSRILTDEGNGEQGGADDSERDVPQTTALESEGKSTIANPVVTAECI
jgi:hypothetical protein